MRQDPRAFRAHQKLTRDAVQMIKPFSPHDFDYGTRVNHQEVHPDYITAAWIPGGKQMQNTFEMAARCDPCCVSVLQIRFRSLVR